MNEWERHANQGLQSLGEAYQRGQIDREAYRARRRRLLRGIREQQAQTQPNLLRPLAQPAATGSTSAVRTGACVKCVALRIVCAIIGLGLVAWWLLRGEG